MPAESLPYHANKAIIITTDKIAKDAQRVFAMLATEAQRHDGHGLVYIEGLDSAEPTLHREISGAALGFAQQRLAIIGDLSGYDLNAVLAAKLGSDAGRLLNDGDLDVPF